MSEAFSPETRRTFRFWGVAELIHAALLIGAVAALLPWKTPAVNVALIAYGALHGMAGLALLRGARVGWRLGLAAGWLGLIAMVIVATGLIGTWAYLHTIYGDFGFGASIGALLFASVALQVLGLIPGLLLRALLRPAVREDMGAGKLSVKVALGLLTVPIWVALGVHVVYGIGDIDPLNDSARGQAVAHLRATLMGETRPTTPALAGVPGDVWVTLYDKGRVGARVRGEGADMAEAIAQAADALAEHPRVKGKRISAGRLKVDRVIGSAPLLSTGPLFMPFAVNPGVDGLVFTNGEFEKTMLPDDLIKAQRFGRAPLVPGIREMRFGLDTRWVLGRLEYKGSGSIRRLRTEGFVETGEQALPVFRGNTPLSTDKAAWKRAAIAGGDFVLRQIQEGGRFHYQYYPLTNHHPVFNPRNYSLPRHAGTVYSLALMHGLTGEARYKDGAEKAIQWLNTQMPKQCGAPDRTCVVKGAIADLGSAALTMVGMLEYQRRTKDARYAGTIRRLANFVLYMQKENGDFHHVFELKTTAPNPAARKMFYSEEAALALVMAHEVLDEQRYLDAARRALDFLTGPKYEGYFLGRFIYGADHWTCIAAEEAWPRLKNPQYIDFCEGYAAFIERMQYWPGNWDNPDFSGHYGFSALMIPQAPAAAGFTEAIVSTYELARHHGRDASRLERQMSLALDALSRDQIRESNAYLMPDPSKADGGIRRSLVESEVRIDFTQHAISALIRGAVIE